MTQLFHKDIGIPDALKAARPNSTLTYGHHARREALADGITSLPKVLPEVFTLVEVEVVKGKPTKWVIRTTSHVAGLDLVLVITADGFVKTLWVNESRDTHRTLLRHLYSVPQAYRGES
jgi:hypothetical protein